MIQNRAEQAGFTPVQIALRGGHSLRSDFVTEADRVGADAHTIMRQTRHPSPVMLYALGALIAESGRYPGVRFSSGFV